MTLFSTYSYKKKKFALLVVVALLGAASYKRSFSVTLDLLSLNQELINKQQEASTSVDRLKIKQNELLLINKIVGKENVPNEQVQQKFLSFFEASTTKLALVKIEEVYTYDHPDFTINTNAITFKGSFIPTVKFLYEMEQDFHFARIVSVHTNTVLNRSTQYDELHTTILLQNFWKAGR